MGGSAQGLVRLDSRCILGVGGVGVVVHNDGGSSLLMTDLFLGLVRCVLVLGHMLAAPAWQEGVAGEGFAASRLWSPLKGLLEFWCLPTLGRERRCGSSVVEPRGQGLHWNPCICRGPSDTKQHQL